MTHYSNQTTNTIAAAYGSPRLNIERILGTEVSLADPDRAIIEPWAATVNGPILDVGSGTGRWTGHLAQLGYAVEGLEPAGRLVKQARTNHPSVTFHHTGIENFGHSTTRWAGILAWYSVIHMGPEQLTEALAVMHKLLDDDGTLLLSFFTGPRRETFDHPIATAYRWPIPDMVRALTSTGFTVTTQHTAPSGIQAHICAVATQN